MVYDCAAKYKQTSLNQELLQGPYEEIHLVGVLSRFRKEPVGIVADIESIFHQVIVDPRDRDSFGGQMVIFPRNWQSNE